MATRTRLSEPDAFASLADELDLGPIKFIAHEESIRESKFFAEYLNRLVTGRDMHVIVTAASETGVGKTTLAVSLAILLDQHGWTADKASVASAQEYDAKYDKVPEGSVLILDEAEKAADARRGMTTESVELSQSFATKRYQQVFGMLTAPSKSWVDKRLGSDAADYWIQAQQTDGGRIKGEAKVYRLKTNEHYNENYTKRTEMIHWPVLDWHTAFQELVDRKAAILESDREKQSFIRREEVEERVEKARKKAKQQIRNDFIAYLKTDGYHGTEIAEFPFLDLSVRSVNRVAKNHDISDQ